jgi:hypothetical protein
LTSCKPAKHGIAEKLWPVDAHLNPPRVNVPTIFEVVAGQGGRAAGFFGHEKLYPSEAEILAHRLLWSFAFSLLLIAWQGRWSEVTQALLSRKQVAFAAASGAAIELNWFMFIWAVNSGQIVQTAAQQAVGHSCDRAGCQGPLTKLVTNARNDMGSKLYTAFAEKHLLQKEPVIFCE